LYQASSIQYRFASSNIEIFYSTRRFEAKLRWILIDHERALMNAQEIEHALESCELFKGVGKDAIEKIAQLCHMDAYRAGEEIFRQGDFGENLYIIADGHISLERAMDLGTRRGNAVIGILGRGRAFGCWSTLLGEAHNLMSSAVCQKPTRVAVMRGSDLRDIMLHNMEIGFNVLEKLCFLLRDRIQGAYGAMEKI